MFCTLLCTSAVLLTLAGCGVKPDFVDPPQGETQDHFPRSYPDKTLNKND